MPLWLRLLVLTGTALALCACGDPNDTQSSRPAVAPSPATGADIGSSSDRVDPIQGRIVERGFGGWRKLNAITFSKPPERNFLGFHLNLFLLEKHPDTIDPVPMLAAGAPVLRGDEQIWTLRPEARWDDGTPVSAADAAATWAAIKAFSRTIARHVYIELGGDDVLDVSALDEKRFRVQHRANGQRAARLFGLAFGVCDARSIPKDPEAMDAARVLAGQGPYRVSDAGIAKNEVTFTRKQPWWGDAVPAFRNRWRAAEYVYREVSDSVQTEEQLQRGDLDIAALASVERYAALKGPEWEKKFDKAHYYLSQFNFIGWNCGRAPFDDARVRRALAHLVPRKKINEERCEGLALSRSGPFFSRSNYSDGDVKPPRYSPKKALELLAEAGWKDSDGDGVLDKDGKPFRFAIMRQSENPDWAIAILDLFAETLRQAGIEMQQDVISGLTLQQRARRHDFDAYILIWGLDVLTPGAGIRALYHSGQRDGGYNWQDFADDETDRLIDAFDQDDETKRVAAAHGLHRRLDELQPMTFLFTNPSCVVWNRRLENVVPHALGVRPWDFRVAR